MDQPFPPGEPIYIDGLAASKFKLAEAALDLLSPRRGGKGLAGGSATALPLAKAPSGPRTPAGVQGVT